jgi:hypothetical protein
MDRPPLVIRSAVSSEYAVDKNFFASTIWGFVIVFAQFQKITILVFWAFTSCSQTDADSRRPLKIATGGDDQRSPTEQDGSDPNDPTKGTDQVGTNETFEYPPDRGPLSACRSQVVDGPQKALGASDIFVGGDSGFSTLLANGNYVSVRGDSMVNANGQPTRVASEFIKGNTLQVSTCKGDQFERNYYYRQGYKAFLPDYTPGQNLWAYQPFTVENTLYIPSGDVDYGTGTWGFKSTRALISVISNTDELDPMRWNVKTFPLFDVEGVWPGAAVVKSNLYVYLFSNVGAIHDVIVSRFPITALTMTPTKVSGLPQNFFKESVETLGVDGKWYKGIDTKNIKRLGLNANSGLTIRKHKASDKWLALFADTSVWPTQDVVVANSSSPFGPWSKPTSIYTIPKNSAVDKHPNTFCYAAYEKPEFNKKPDTHVFFSYACNNDGDNLYLWNNMGDYGAAQNGLYFMRYIYVPLTGSALPVK